MRLLIGLCVFAVFATPGIADENNRLFLGLGYDDFREIREPSAIVSVDYDFAQIWKFKRWKWRLSGVAISDGDYWVGAGISFSHRFGGGPWYAEANFAPGYYYRGKAAAGKDHGFLPIFQSQAAIGYHLKSGGDIAIVFSHHSDGQLDEGSPVTESILIRYGKAF